MATATASKYALQWAKAWDAEVIRHTDELKTWTLEEQHSEDRPLPYIMTLRSKTNQYGRLEKHKIRCAVRSDRMRPRLDFDETRKASHMPIQEGSRLLIAAAAAKG